MKKLLSVLLLIMYLWMIFVKQIEASDEKYFRVTAYYSPLPDQKYYLRWNYKKEIRMNWKWIRWASWKEVFSGMIAAPKKYKFWTKIYLEWLGVWEVSDRWWAIVEAWKRNFKHDRLDIWVWYGDEGLRRAMYWWNRVIKWKIINEKENISIDYNNIKSPYWTIHKLSQKTENIKNKWKSNINSIKKTSKIEPIKQKSEFEIFLEKELKIFEKKISTEKQVALIQESLSDMDMYSWKISWKYKDIIDTIYYYQIDKKLIKNKYDKAAWYFGPKTRQNLKEDYKEYLIKEKENVEKLEQFEKDIENLKIKVEKKADIYMKQIWRAKFWDISNGVRNLQKVLKKLWYFSHKDTAIFWEKTRKAIISYQLENKVISKVGEIWTWYFWPKTRESLKQKLKENFFLEELNKNQELANYYRNKNQELAKESWNSKL